MNTALLVVGIVAAVAAILAWLECLRNRIRTQRLARPSLRLSLLGEGPPVRDNGGIHVAITVANESNHEDSIVGVFLVLANTGRVMRCTEGSSVFEGSGFSDILHVDRLKLGAKLAPFGRQSGSLSFPLPDDNAHEAVLFVMGASSVFAGLKLSMPAARAS